MKIPLFKIYSDNNDNIAVNKVISRKSFWTTGPEIDLFENKIASYVGAKYCVSFNSGTSALHALLQAYEVDKGDEVIVPSFTFIATANAALFVDAKPIFADIEEKTYGLDAKDVRKKITYKTKAIILIHYGGCPALHTQKIKKIAKENNIFLFEDAAEAYGSKINGKSVGNSSNASIWSFCQNKIITTGEGGAITTNSKAIYKKLKMISSQGRYDKENFFSTTKKSDYVTLGYNFRMSSISAALGISQANKAEKIINKRIKIAKRYNQILSDIKQIQTPYAKKDHRHTYQLYTIRYKNVPKIQEFLKRKNIQTKVYFDPVHTTYLYKTHLKYRVSLPATERLSREVLTLPLYPDMTFAEQNYVVDSIKEYLSNYD